MQNAPTNVQYALLAATTALSVPDAAAAETAARSALAVDARSS